METFSIKKHYFTRIFLTFGLLAHIVFSFCIFSKLEQGKFISNPSLWLYISSCKELGSNFSIILVNIMTFCSWNSSIRSSSCWTEIINILKKNHFETNEEKICRSHWMLPWLCWLSQPQNSQTIGCMESSS